MLALSCSDLLEYHYNINQTLILQHIVMIDKELIESSREK